MQSSGGHRGDPYRGVFFARERKIPTKQGNFLQITTSELYKNVVVAWLAFPAQSQMRLFLEYRFPEKNITEAVTRDMAFSDWLKLAALCLFRAQSEPKNKSICDCAGARPQSDRAEHSYLVHS